jgi:hypothetical protein
VNKSTNPDRAPDRAKVIAADADELLGFDGRDIINALAGSLLAEVTIERRSVKSKVRDVDL